MENQSKKMVQIVYDALDEKLGEDIEILKVDEISVIADYLVIANGRNQNQLNAMTDLVEEKMIEAGYKSKRIEGNKNSSWVLMDYGDVIAHVFSKEDRLFYDLDQLLRILNKHQLHFLRWLLRWKEDIKRRVVKKFPA